MTYQKTRSHADVPANTGLLIVFAASLCLAVLARAQWTVSFQYDDAQATAALGAERVTAMAKALDRAKAKLEQVLGNSTGNVIVEVKWEDPDVASAIAQSHASKIYSQTVSVARDKLINKATADSKPQAEITLYEALPGASVPFYWNTSTLHQASNVAIYTALNRHLQFRAHDVDNDGFLRFRPPDPVVKWQFFRGKRVEGHQVFEIVVLHETMHLLGFDSAAEQDSLPGTLFSWDLFRVAEGSVPVNSAQFPTIPRELRPTAEASWISRLNTSLGSYKASRGKRTGGDGYQASHWRFSGRLDPATPIGVMDPSADSGAIYDGLGKFYLAKADVEALDTMGWNADPSAHVYAAAGNVNLIAPTSGQTVRSGQPVGFSWQSSPYPPDGWILYIYAGASIADDQPLRAYENLASPQYDLLGSEAIPPGEYVWTVVAAHKLGDQTSETRALLVVCPSDYNMDSFVTGDDLDAFGAAFLLGDPSTDFNADGFVTGDDFDAYVVAFVAGC